MILHVRGPSCTIYPFPKSLKGQCLVTTGVDDEGGRGGGIAQRSSLISLVIFGRVSEKQCVALNARRRRQLPRRGRPREGENYRQPDLRVGKQTKRRA